MFFRYLSLCLLIFSLVSCSKTTYHHGFIFDQQDISNLKVGVDNQDKIQQIFGSPTTKSEFGPETWYYISSRVEKKIFRSPKEIERHVVAFDFDQSGIVKNFKQFDLEHGVTVEFSKEATKSAGDDTRALKQFLGNIGRFNKNLKARKAPAGHI